MNFQVCDCDPLEYCEHRLKRDQIWINTSRIFSDSMERSKQLAIDATKGIMMAKYDQGGGCPCGLYKECDPGCIEYKAYHDRQPKEFPDMYDAPIDKDQPQVRYDSPIGDKNPIVARPWGKWEVLDVDQGYKVKRLSILPDQAISLQYHNHRSEHWTIVQGKGKVIVDGNIFTVEKGESFHVPRMALHKITNTQLNETLIAIEVQMGDICSEDDIVRC